MHFDFVQIHKHIVLQTIEYLKHLNVAVKINYRNKYIINYFTMNYVMNVAVGNYKQNF